MSKQLSFEEYQSSVHNMEIYLFADGVRLIENIGGLFRLADAMGVKKILFSESKESYNPTKLKKISRSTSEFVPAVWEVSAENLLGYVPENVGIVALEYTADSDPITAIPDDLQRGPLVLVIGSEVTGVSPTMLEEADEVVHLPMYGRNSSMNVTIVTGMALYELLRDFK